MERWQKSNRFCQQQVSRCFFDFLLHHSVWTPRLMTNPNYFFGSICWGTSTSKGNHQAACPLADRICEQMPLRGSERKKYDKDMEEPTRETKQKQTLHTQVSPGKCLIPDLICFKSPVGTLWGCLFSSQRTLALSWEAQHPCLYSLAPLVTADWMRGRHSGWPGPIGVSFLGIWN